MAWNTGATSTIELAVNKVERVASETIITRAGTVVAGFGAGHRAIGTVTYVNVALGPCATTGLAALSGAATIEILPL